MLLCIPLAIAEGFNVGSSTISTLSAPLGSLSVSTISIDLVTGGGGGGGGGEVSSGDDVALVSIRELLLLLSPFFLRKKCFGDEDKGELDFDLSVCSAELRRECGPDETES